MKFAKYLSWSLGILSAVAAQAQDDFALSLLRSVPQHSRLLPGSRPAIRAHFAPFGMSSIHVQLENDWFHPGMWFEEVDGRGVFQPERFLEDLEESNRLGYRQSLELLSLGFSTGRDQRDYWGISVRHAMHFGVGLPGDFLSLPWTGNAQWERHGGVINGGGLNFQFQQHLEGGVLWHRTWDERWSSGIRMKGILGLQFAGLRDVEWEWRTDSTTYAWTMSGTGALETSNLSALWDATTDGTSSDLLGIHQIWEARNPGWGLDVGIEWRAKPGLATSLHLVDWGRIFWKSDPVVFTLEPSEWRFDGIQLGDILDEEDLSQDSIAGWGEAFLNRADSLAQWSKEYSGFTTRLPWTLRLQHRNELYQTEAGKGGVAVQLQWSPHTESPAQRSFLGIAFYHEKGRGGWSLVGSMDDQKAFALGTAGSIQIGPVQWYVSIDNLLVSRMVAFEWQDPMGGGSTRLLFPYHAEYIQFHTGLQFVLRKKME